MNTSALRPLARTVSFSEDAMMIEFMDGRNLAVPLVYFPRLLQAAPVQRNSFEISGGGAGLHWDELDEDISVEHLLMGVFDRTKQMPERKAA